TCFQGGIAVLDSSGNVKPGVTATGLIPAGVFTAQVDNSTGSAADVTATVQPGTFRFGNSAGGDEITKAEIGDTCYLVDDQTVAKTNGSSTRSAAGQIVDVDTSGVWVRVGMDRLITTGLLAANNLSDVAAAATARTNLGGGANKIALVLGDVSTKGSDAAVLRVVSPVAGTIDKVWSVLNAALATGDATLTGKIGANAITNGVITITQAGSAAGDVDSATPSAAKTVAAGDVISFTGGGTSDATSTATVSLLITPTA
ncbi:MAG TPA: hypothetical protein PLY96_08895, partial [Chromatiaceae bacterium]|nr:hypothetical protein [Chromatiaceae bacterium]